MDWNCYTMNNSIRQPKQIIKIVDREMKEGIIGMEKKKKLPIGIEYFKDFGRDNFYYVDKTAFIRDLIDLRGSINLFTRPRRFGKSLNMNMLKTFLKLGQIHLYLTDWKYLIKRPWRKPTATLRNEGK